MYKKIFTLLFPIAIGATQVNAQSKNDLDKFEPNNYPPNALINSKLTSSSTVKARIGVQDDVDWYYVPSISTLTATLTDIPKECNLDLEFWLADDANYPKYPMIRSRETYNTDEHLSIAVIPAIPLNLYIRVSHAKKDYTGNKQWSDAYYTLILERKLDRRWIYHEAANELSASWDQDRLEKFNHRVYAPSVLAAPAISVAPSAQKVEKETILFAYPNPAKEVINFDFIASAAGDRTATITDLNGNVVATQKVTAQEGPNTVSLALTGVKAGLYNLNVTGMASVKFQVAE